MKAYRIQEALKESEISVSFHNFILWMFFSFEGLHLMKVETLMFCLF